MKIRRLPSHILLFLAAIVLPIMATGMDRVFQGTHSSTPIEIKKHDRYGFSCGSDAERQRIDVGVKAAAAGKIDWSINYSDTTNHHEIVLHVKLEDFNKYDIDHDEDIVITVDIDGERMLTKISGHKLPISRSPIFVRTLFNGAEISVMAGPGRLDYVGKIPYSGYVDSIEVTSVYDVTLCRHTSLYLPAPDIPHLYDKEEAIAEALASVTDPRCGIYRFFDEDVETTIAVKGGYYRLALLPAENGGYNLVYIDGARVKRDKWTAGMLKAWLEPTPFVGTYTLYWTDSDGNTLDDMSPYATLEGALLTVVFPIQKAKFRFVKEQ